MKKEKILIVEDELDLLDLVDFNLTRKGFLTAGALDGLEAMEKIDSFKPDIVVLDLMLPKLDGWEICRRLRRNKNDIPIIMLTAKCMPGDKITGFDAGADDYITKPFHIRELLIRIDSLLEKKRDKDLQRMLIHEMTNRMATIGGYSQLLSKKAGTSSLEERSKYISDISRQVDHTTALISEIGTLIDAESGGFSLMTERCDIMEIVKQISESYGSIAHAKGIDMTIKAYGAIPEIEANPVAVKLVFENLIGNAVKYSMEDGIVEISAKAGTNGVTISIDDNGPGIPDEDKPRIFQKGYRASNAINNKNGSGFGLYIAKTLLDRMDAVLTFESVEGKGSAFAVLFKRGGN